jgi:hypothetical protein
MRESREMPIAPIPLTEAEKALLERIEFDALKIRAPEQVKAICSAARELTLSLLNRKAVPDHRVQWFTAPEHNIGGHKSSRKENLERNANGGDVLSHVHFLPYLRYFIFGPQLPSVVIDRFGDAVRECGMVTSGDIIPLGDPAKRLTRDYRVDKHDAAEEFYKLALEHRMVDYQARSIRDRVKKSR